MIMEPEVDGNAKQRRVNSEPASVNEETAARGAWCRYNLLSFGKSIFITETRYPLTTRDDRWRGCPRLLEPLGFGEVDGVHRD